MCTQNEDRVGRIREDNNDEKANTPLRDGCIERTKAKYRGGKQTHSIKAGSNKCPVSPHLFIIYS